MPLRNKLHKLECSFAKLKNYLDEKKRASKSWWLALFLYFPFSNPDHQQHPFFEEVRVYLQKPTAKLVYWSHSDDTIAENINSLGAELDIASELYLDLQVMYKENNDYEAAP